MATGEKPADSADIAESLGDMDKNLEAGDTVGEYEIEGLLGEGGFGTVYRAKHPVIGKPAAVKVLARKLSSDPEMVSRFVSEARVVNTIGHANIIDVFNFGTLEDGRRYFVMELLDGLPLDAYLRQTGPLQPNQVLAIMRDVAKALDAAHAKSVVHRDLKPANIFLSFDDEDRPRPKLLDFGIAKLRGDVATTGHKTKTGAPIGTPHYMSPEQCLGKEVDGRTDVYAFGVVCFEALTGTPPFDDDSYLALMTKHTSGERPKASERNADLGDQYDEALATIMAKDPEDRPSTLMEAMDLLAQASGEPQPVSVVVRDLPRPSGAQDDLELATAKTSMDASSSVGPTSRRPSRSRSRTGIIVGVTLVAGVGLYFATAGLGSSSTPTAAPTADPSPSASPATSASSTAPPQAEASAPPGASEQVPAEPTRFEVRLLSDVQGAVAYSGDEKLGPLPGPFTLDGDRGDEKTLHVRAPGYEMAEVKVELEPDAEVSVKLSPIPQRQLNRDLEDPGL